MAFDYTEYILPILVIFALIALLTINKFVIQKVFSTNDHRLIIQRSIALFLSFAALIAFILVLPIKESLQGQILSVIAIIISAGIALSSTTVLGNIMAGLMNSSMNRFRNGDLIEIEKVQGRLVRKSPFHIEVQTEDSNFVTFPNLHVASNPVKIIRKSKSVISTSVSLGYDVSRTKIEQALMKAAKQAELNDAYVFIEKLGDFSVSYKVHGFLEDSSAYFSAFSKLNGAVLDSLHEAGIEIVSPTFMNQRQVGDSSFIPEKATEPEKKPNEASPEELIFDEAMKSEALEERKKAVEKLEDQLEKLKKSDSKVSEDRINRVKERMELLKERIKEEVEKRADRDA